MSVQPDDPPLSSAQLEAEEAVVYALALLIAVTPTDRALAGHVWAFPGLYEDWAPVFLRAVALRRRR